MSIGEQFKGLDMKNLIGGPLTAAAESSILLARSTANFINEVGFDANQQARTVAFKFTKQDPDPDGNLNMQEMSIDVPLLAIVPIPNLQIDEVNILFDMEVKQCEKSESSMSGSGSFSARVGWGPVSVSVSGSVSAHSSNTRSSDNSAKYHVDVRATNHGTPEGLARVLDMMASAVSPNLIGSRPVDPSGAELTGARRERSLKIKELRQKSMQLENAENAARETRTIKLGALTKRLQTIQNTARMSFEDKFKAASEDEKKKLNEDAVNNFWNDLQIGAHDKVSLAASLDGKNASIEKVCSAAKGYEEFTTAKVKDADGEFKQAVEAHLTWEESNKAVQENKVVYNNVLMGVADTKAGAAKTAS
ncbi:MAG: DUF2589 domain-containing protein [Chitinispirillales bacterium]|jgi:hypothetical protein|nr:DUF2589 domain-containing protein [Chitinispirillales bacterium]